MKRSFVAGFEAGFDACTIHGNDELVGDKPAAFLSKEGFAKWLLDCKRRRGEEVPSPNPGMYYQNDKVDQLSV